MYLYEILTHLNDVKNSGNKYTALCPAHDDNRRSLSLCEVDGRILVHCFAGCTFQEIVQAMGLNAQDFFH